MKSPLLIILALGALSISGCNSTRNSKSGSAQGRLQAEAHAAAEAKIASERRAEALARFATGISYELKDQSELALEQFRRSALADPTNERLVLDLARRYAQTKDHDKSVEVLSNAASQPQASGNIFSSLARAYLAIGKTNLAVTASQAAIKRSPAMISGYQTLTEIFLKNGQTEDALKMLNSAARPTNSDSLFLLHLGDLYGKVAETKVKGTESATQRGIDVLNRASDQKPTNPNTRHRLADSFARVGEWKKAAELYLGLLGEFGDIPLMRDGLREKLTNLYLKSSDKSKAAEQLEAVVNDSPTRYPEAWYYLGNFAYEAKNYPKAAEYFGRALVINPDYEQVYYDWAGMQISTDQAGEALKTLGRAREKFPDSFTVEFLTGLAYARLKSFPDAIKHFTAAEVIGSATDPRRLNHLFYFQVGATHERNQDYAQAETYFEKSLQLAPNFADALNYVGYMWADRGENLEKARDYIEKAVKLEPKNSAFLDSMGWVLYKLKQHEPALQYLLQAVEFSEAPDATVYDHLGDVYSALKQNDKAREAWKKSLTLEPSETINQKLQSNSTSL